MFSDVVGLVDGIWRVWVRVIWPWLTVILFSHWMDFGGVCWSVRVPHPYHREQHGVTSQDKPSATAHVGCKILQIRWCPRTSATSYLIFRPRQRDMRPVLRGVDPKLICNSSWLFMRFKATLWISQRSCLSTPSHKVPRMKCPNRVRNFGGTHSKQFYDDHLRLTTATSHCRSCHSLVISSSWQVRQGFLRTGYKKRRYGRHLQPHSMVICNGFPGKSHCTLSIPY